VIGPPDGFDVAAARGPFAGHEGHLDVPFATTPAELVERMLDLAGVGPGDRLVDLGCGDGRIAIAAARRGARALGVDLDPERIAEAEEAARDEGLDGRACFRCEDLFDTPLGDADIVTLYLLTHVNRFLRPRLLADTRPGTRIVSHAFPMGGWRPDRRWDEEPPGLFCWIVPADAGGDWLIETAAGDRLELAIVQTYQDVAGTLAGRPLLEASLRGRRLRFTADLPRGPTSFQGVVGDSEIAPDPDAPGPGWRARRAG